MTPGEIAAAIVSSLPGVVPKTSWGETALFYNPGNTLPNGVYFCTLKDHDGKNDRSSNLDREGVFRLAIGLNAETYLRLFGPKPSRPEKGGIVNTGHDFTRVNALMPHPVYAWMGWAQVLSPTEKGFNDVLPLVEEAFHAAAAKFNKRTASMAHQGTQRVKAAHRA
jgi:hypothetical protein